MEVEYQEVFEKTINKSYLNTLLNELSNTYKGELGWVIGKPQITDINESQIKVAIPLTKYKLNQNDDIYREIFAKKTSKSNVDYIMQNITETYTEDKGWHVGDPVITDLGNGEVLIQVPLEKRTQGIRR